MAKKQKTVAKLKKELQLIFNAYIRKRDEDKPCISCGLHKENKQAGHFFSVKGYDGLRFDPDNVHGECAGCNCFDESHLIYYNENLISRIGIERFRNLKDKAYDYKKNGYKWSRSELLQLIEKYKQLLKDSKI